MLEWYSSRGFFKGGIPLGEISPFGDGDGGKLSPRAGTGIGNGWYILNGDANVLTIPDGDSPVAISGDYYILLVACFYNRCHMCTVVSENASLWKISDMFLTNVTDGHAPFERFWHSASSGVTFEVP
jgi:hypothetical protein